MTTRSVQLSNLLDYHVVCRYAAIQHIAPGWRWRAWLPQTAAMPQPAATPQALHSEKEEE